ncbi:MAG TPA: hypothetical protein VFV64_06490, partial [Permianibacter sp.]|nr:hypothetical protein [Permianibacter sp.]
MNLSIIYTKENVLLSTKAYASWREIQEEFEDCTASFGPWSVEDVTEFLRFEYSNLNPAVEIQVREAVA